MMLLAEPDCDIAAAILNSAGRRGIRAEWCRDGGETLILAGATQPDLLVVAARLPTLSARKVIQIVRNRWRMAILVGASSGDERLVTDALDAGAAAVVARPYDLDSIMSVGLSVTSWTQHVADPRDTDADVIAAGPISVDLQRHEARLDGQELHFTHRELQLLIYLIRRAGRVASRTEISAAVWGHDSDTNTVAVHVKRLRDKLGDHPEHGQVIRTIRGAGYRLAPSLCPQARSTAS